jgi:hypothetical protein
VPTIYHRIVILNGGHASLCPPYEFSRHCKRSEAIHRAAKQEWIASSLRFSQ